MNNPLEQKRAEEYDVLRVILILLVVFGHIHYRAMSFGHGELNFIKDPEIFFAFQGSFFIILKKIIDAIYSFHMSLFFALSGAVCFIQRKKLKKGFNFIVNKINRLLVPYLLTGLFFMIPIKYLIGGYKLEEVPGAMLGLITLTNDSGDFTFINDQGHLWFLVALFWCFVLFVLLYRLLCSTKQRLLLLIIIGIVFNLISPLPIFNTVTLNLGMKNLIWFIFGFCFGSARLSYIEWSKNNKVLYNSIVIISGILVFLNILYCVFLPQLVSLPNYVPPFLLTFIQTLTAGIFLYAISSAIAYKPKTTNNKMFKTLLKYNMIIYLLHDPMNFVILQISTHYKWITSGTGIALELLLRFAGTIIVSILLGYIINSFKAFAKKIIAK